MVNVINKNHFFLLTFAVYCCSCTEVVKPKTANIDSKTESYTPHKRLLTSTSKYLMEDGEEVSLNGFTTYENFVKSYFSVAYKNDSILINALQSVNCCGETIGDIRISNDTIRVYSTHVSDEACSCNHYEVFSYTVSNPENEEYIILNE